jgi:hypothetical protein
VNEASYFEGTSGFSLFLVLLIGFSLFMLINPFEWKEDTLVYFLPFFWFKVFLAPTSSCTEVKEIET